MIGDDQVSGWTNRLTDTWYFLCRGIGKHTPFYKNKRQNLEIRWYIVLWKILMGVTYKVQRKI